MDIKGKRLRLLYPDVHGLERGKYLFGDMAEAGHAAFCIGVYPLTHDREILPVPNTQFDVGLPDIEVHLDRDSLRTSWEPETLIGIGDATFRGEPVPIDPRHVLRRAVDAWRAMGLEPQISFELEFYLMEPDGGGGWRPVSLPGHRVYGTGMSIDPSGCVDDMVTTAIACGFPVESWGSEYDEAAYEVNIRYSDAIPAADDAFVFRLLVRELAARHGKLATFMGRPMNDRGGSGMHVNFSFRREDGSNAFHDPNDPEGLSDTRPTVGGGRPRPPHGHGRDHGEPRERVQATAARHAERLLGDLGPRRPECHRAGPAGPGRRHPARAADRRRRREPVPRRRRGPERGPASAWRTRWSSARRRPSAASPTPTCASPRTCRRRSTR